LDGKKVAVYQTFFDEQYCGTWRQYIYCPLNQIYVLPETSSSLTQYLGNPLTVVGLFNLMMKNPPKAIIQDAACSSIAKMVFKYAAKKGIEVINIVRSDKQLGLLKEIESKHILNSTDERFYEELSEIVDNLKPTVFLDAIGNEMVGKVLKLMPPTSTAIIYGTLDPSNLGISSVDVLFGAKTITHFGVPFWLQTLTKEEKQKHVDEIMEDFASGGEVFGCNIHKTYNFDSYIEALEEYPKFRSDGKLIIKMN
jgi:NADPH:quinone reductase-like Zn-dependent oxidoreductase